MLRFINAMTSFASVDPRANAPSFSIPTSWRSPTTNVTADEAAALTRVVAGTLMKPIGQSTGQIQGFSEDQTAMFIDALARLDYKAGTTNYRDFVTNSIAKTATGFNVTRGGALPIAVEWGVAAARAHLAYNDSQVLKTAASLWDAVNAYFVTPGDAAAGSHPLRAIPIAGSCRMRTTAGAVLSVAEPADNTVVNTETTGGFSTLSAYLFQITSDIKYKTAAELSAQFLMNVMFDNGVIGDSIRLGGCHYNFNVFLLTYNSGKTLEAISVIASSNASWVPTLNGLVASTVPFANWTGHDGVITEGPSPSDFTHHFLYGGPRKAYLIRGLYEAWERTSNTAMAKYIQAYLTVQFNALQDLARSPGANNYSPTWTGRAPSASLIPEGQLAALDVLSAQIGFARARDASASAVNNTVPSPTNVPTPMFTPLDSPPPSHSPSPSPSLSPSSSPSFSTSPTPTPTPSATVHRNSAKIIAGSVCGGLVLVVLVLLGVWYIRRRRWLPRHRPDRPAKTDPRLIVPQPFLMTQSTAPTLPQKRRPPPSPEEAATDVLDGANQRHDASLDAGPSGDTGSARGSQDVGRGSNEGVEIRGHHGGENEVVPASKIIERFHAIVARFIPGDTHKALPSYYNRPMA